MAYDTNQVVGGKRHAKITQSVEGVGEKPLLKKNAKPSVGRVASVKTDTRKDSSDCCYLIYCVMSE
jgi:hypothetical protein